MKSRSRIVVSVVSAAAVCGVLGSTAASGAVYKMHNSEAVWTAALADPAMVQNFQGYGDSQWMMGVEFLPGVRVTTNVDALRVYQNYLGQRFLFAVGNRAGDTRYDLALTQPYTAVGFDIVSFEADPNQPSSAAGPGTLTVYFADATAATMAVSGNPAGDPVFVGVTADLSIVGVRWEEPLEYLGGNEETGIDNVRVGFIPEPGGSAMGLLGAGLLILRRRHG